MIENIFTILSTLSEEQWKKLKKMVLASHSRDSDTFKILKYIKARQDHSPSKWNAEKIRSKTFPNIKHKRFLNLLSVLNGQLEDFFVLEYYQSDRIKKDVLLNKIYNSKGFYLKANQKAKRVKKRIDQDEKLTLEKHQLLSKLLHQQYYSDNPIKYKNGEQLLQDLIESELAKTHLQILVYKCELINWGRIKNYDYSSQIRIIAEIEKATTESELSNYLKTLEELLLKPSEENFVRLRSILYKRKLSHPSELHTIFTMYLLNTSIRLWHMDLYRNADENAKLFEYALETGVLMYNEKIPVIRFHSLISTLGSLKSFDWTHQFIQTWKVKVVGKSIVSTVNLASAQNAFIHKKYDHIVPLIRGMQFEHSSQKLIALGLELVALYIDRRQDYALLRNFVGNFKRTIKRLKESVSEQQFLSHLNLIKVVELLIKKDFTRTTIHLEKYKFLIYRSWLETQINKAPQN